MPSEEFNCTGNDFRIPDAQRRVSMAICNSEATVSLKKHQTPVTKNNQNLAMEFSSKNKKLKNFLEVGGSFKTNIMVHPPNPRAIRMKSEIDN